MTERLASLAEKIKVAFAAVPQPEDDRIIQCDCEDCFELRDLFKNKDWRTLPRELIEEKYTKLPLFSPWAFRYFLPAYMSLSLEYMAEPSYYFERNGETFFICPSGVPDHTGFALAPHQSEPDSDEEVTYGAKYKFFTLEEISVMCEFSELWEEIEQVPEIKAEICEGRVRMKRYWQIGQEIELILE